MGLINWYYYLAFNENKRLEQQQEEDAKRAKAEANAAKGKPNSGLRPHPSQGQLGISDRMMSELQEELEEGGL